MLHPTHPVSLAVTTGSGGGAGGHNAAGSIDQCTGRACNDRGICSAGECTCAVDWLGDNCETFAGLGGVVLDGATWLALDLAATDDAANFEGKLFTLDMRFKMDNVNNNPVLFSLGDVVKITATSTELTAVLATAPTNALKLPIPMLEGNWYELSLYYDPDTRTRAMTLDGVTTTDEVQGSAVCVPASRCEGIPNMKIGASDTSSPVQGLVAWVIWGLGPERWDFQFSRGSHGFQMQSNVTQLSHCTANGCQAMAQSVWNTQMSKSVALPSRDYTKACPEGWLQGAGEVCTAPCSLTGPCATTTTDKWTTAEERNTFAAECLAPWPFTGVVTMAASVLDVLSSTARRLLQRPAPILGEATTTEEVSMLTEETLTHDLEFQSPTGANKTDTGAV